MVLRPNEITQLKPLPTLIIIANDDLTMTPSASDDDRWAN